MRSDHVARVSEVRRQGEIAVRSREIEMRLSGSELMARPSIPLRTPGSGDVHTAWNRYIVILQP